MTVRGICVCLSEQADAGIGAVEEVDQVLLDGVEARREGLVFDAVEGDVRASPLPGDGVPAAV
jgi:hypothetical protein